MIVIAMLAALGTIGLWIIFKIATFAFDKKSKQDIDSSMKTVLKVIIDFIKKGE